MVNRTKSNWTKHAVFLVIFMGVAFSFPHQTPIETKAEELIILPIEVSQVKTAVATLPIRQGSFLQIDSIGVNIPLGQTGLDEAGHLIVPANPNAAAWYKVGPKIGAAGTALITGHLDSAAGPGVFYNLRKVSVGDEIRAAGPDGKVAVYRVDKLASYPQDDSFPWSEVYSTTGTSRLRIITCDGAYNPATGLYSHNLVVYASQKN